MGQHSAVSLLSLLLIIHLCVQLSTTKQFFVLIAPNILHTGNDEKIIVQCHECENIQDLPVDIIVKNFPKNDKSLAVKTTHLSASNNFLATANIKIPYDYLSTDSNEKQYVIVRASSQSLFEIEKVILVSPHTGYIFIQTDKTIYTPNQNVNYRIFSTDKNLDPAEREVIVLFQNPNGIIVHREQKKISNGLTGLNLKIPELVTFGTWKIIAKFAQAQQNKYTTQFEVQEYVLPTFSVELGTEKKFFNYKDNELVVNIKATHVFGEKVNGYAVAIFVLYKDFLKTLHGSVQRVEIKDGEGSIVLKREKLLEAVNNENELIGHFIYANVTVFSADGDYVTVHKTNIKIVSSPYNVAFTRTPSYFKPGLPFKITVSVTYPDMTPAVGVLVVCGEVTGRTTEEGLAYMPINTESSQKELRLTVKTADKVFQDEQQANATMIAKAYQPTWKQNFLHIEPTLLNDAVNINMHIKSEDKIAEKITHFTILVMSQGKILKTIYQKRSRSEIITALKFDVTPDMLPSFRIVAYYYVFHDEKFLELVSDSALLHMKRTCKGILKINQRGRQTYFYRPQETVELQLTGDKGAHVGLVAVDKGVFVINNQSRLTQDKIWDDIQQNDIGCTAGGGANPLGVFQDAGLDFTTNLDIQTPARKDLSCSSSKHGRSRRSIQLLEAKQKKASATPEYLRPCCLAGLHESPMGLSCTKRRKQVQQAEECTDMFFECCLHAEELKKQFTADLGWDRSDDTEEDLEEDIAPRRNFPESWRWNAFQLKADSKENTVTEPLDLLLPDSITTWIIQAVSIKKDKGICISEPHQVNVFKEFFIDLRMPYSVIKNEQVQIRAIIHNYMTAGATVKVKFFYDKNICSLATKSRGYQETVKVPAKSSRVVYYVVIPIQATEVYIDVLATVSSLGLGIADRVRKILHVLPEGKLVRKQALSATFNPKGNTQLIYFKTEALEGMVPDSTATNFISIQGDIMGETLLGILDDSYLGSLIYVPYGCPEQNMITTTPNVIVTKYLDATKRWDAVGAEKRSKAISNIEKGYQTQLSHFSGDSFQGSTWLTAYVVKIFSMASKANFLYVDQNMLCKSAIWLVNNQKENGEFGEPGIVYEKSMQGGYAESESSLTAFVLIALAELGNTCDQSKIENAIKKAERNLAAKLPNLEHTYSAVITSYALALVGNTKTIDIIDLFANKDRTFWPVENSQKALFTVEATGYALLQKLKLQKFEEAHKIAEWLVNVRSFGGGYRSTQATAIALQALAQYQIDTSTQETVSLDVQLVVEGRDKPLQYKIQNNDAYLERTNKVMTLYQALLNEEQQCNGFTLKADMKQHETKRETYILHIRTRYQGDLPATMTIIEITMLSGFVPNIQDLKQLTDEKENYIMKFETKTSGSNGTVVLYLPKVPNNEDSEIGFGIHKMSEIGLLQPADISIYEYYDLDKKCSTFYNLPNESGHLRKICKGSLCKCATENCACLGNMTAEDLKEKACRVGVNFEKCTCIGKMTAEDLKERACKVGVDFVVKAKLTHSSRNANYDYYNFTIMDVIKEGADIKSSTTGHQRQFLNHMACSESLQLKINMEYLIMNHYSNVWEISATASYMFSTETVIFVWPKDNHLLETFAENMKDLGCNT
ncbi:complement C3-like isoform X2 [Engystomops pustulosus]|uniref:complement C3-like isoform X2 n=1 Tax=Engystomops pustulosus TaxID=76066 RepID=UPI003AFA9370